MRLPKYTRKVLEMSSRLGPAPTIRSVGCMAPVAEPIVLDIRLLVQLSMMSTALKQSVLASRPWVRLLATFPPVCSLYSPVITGPRTPLLLTVRKCVPFRRARLSLVFWVRTVFPLFMTTRPVTLCLSRQLVVPTTWLLLFLGSMTAPPPVPVWLSRSHRKVHEATGKLTLMPTVCRILLAGMPVRKVVSVVLVRDVLANGTRGTAYIGSLKLVSALPIEMERCGL